MPKNQGGADPAEGGARRIERRNRQSPRRAISTLAVSITVNATVETLGLTRERG